MEKIFTDVELKSKKIKDIFYAIESQLTDEEREEFSNLSGNEQREFISTIYRRLNPLPTEDVVKEDKKDEQPQAKVTVGTKGEVQTVTVEDGPKEEKPTEKTETVDETVNKPESKETIDGPIQPINVEIGTVTGEGSPTSFSVDDYIQCTIRGTPNLNGTCTKSVQSILELLFRYPTAVVQFKTVARAQQFVDFVVALKSVKGCGIIDAERRAKIIKSLKLANKLPL